MRKSIAVFLAALLVISATVQDGNAAAKKPVPKKFTAKIPITLPVAQSGPITFTNVVKNFQDIPEQAWQNVQAAVDSNTAPSMPINIVIGPNTKTTNAQIVSLIQREYALFNGFAEPPTYTGLVFSATDYAWALAKLPKMFSGLAGGKEMLPAASVVDFEGCRQLLQAATTIYLRLPLEKVLERTGDTGIGRQALKEHASEVITERFLRRDPLYREVSKFTIDLGSNPKSDAESIVAYLEATLS